MSLPDLWEMEQMDFKSPECGDELSEFAIKITHRKVTWTLSFTEDSTVTDLFDYINDVWGITPTYQKILVPKGPMLKHPLKEPKQPLASFQGKNLTLLGVPTKEIETLTKTAAKIAQRNASLSERKPARPQWRKPPQNQYTFAKIEPLNYLPHPELSRKLLQRLAADAGIKAVMRKHKWNVPLLTEMEPLSNTESSHEGTSRTLGLNRNKGEVIELRLRTDTYDGYRDYKTIRKTLCHELAHNVHGPHDSHFWNLCHQIEREVEASTYTSGGQTIAPTSAYHISGQDDGDAEDGGGWEGGEYVLGGISAPSAGGFNRRQILANAVMKRMQDAAEQAEASTMPPTGTPQHRNHQKDPPSGSQG